MTTMDLESSPGDGDYGPEAFQCVCGQDSTDDETAFAAHLKRWQAAGQGDLHWRIFA